MRVDGDGEHVLASDAERTRVAVWLGIAFEEGRLDLAEFDRRTRCVWAAHTQSELAVLTRDLPSVPESDLAGRLKPAPPRDRERLRKPPNRAAAAAFVAGLVLGGFLVSYSGSIWPIVLLLLAVGAVGGLGWVFWDPYGHRGRRD
ncbi:MAG TPA: DUF1707 domain-containing protein [Micromonosporaceae bacterium]|nr:DUF1707 domain-containing protein [Micromonosporaceae bacterium]